MSGARATIGRRRFVQLMGWAGAAAAAHGGPALAAAAKKSRTTGRPADHAPAPSPATESAPAVSEEARALAEVVRRRYGDHLSPQDIETITRDLDGDLQGIQRLCEAKLTNADEPDTVFRA